MSIKSRHVRAGHRWDEPPLSDLLGKVPDWLVALVAGTSQGNVVFVRKARRIKARAGGLEGVEGVREVARTLGIEIRDEDPWEVVVDALARRKIRVRLVPVREEDGAVSTKETE